MWAEVSRESQEEYPTNSLSRITADPSNYEDYITQLSEEIEGRLTKKLSQEFSWTKIRILGAFSKLNKFLLNPQVRA